MDPIKFFQLNVCGLSERSSKSLEKYANECNADFIFLSETKASSDTPMKNYEHFYKPNKKNSRCGGVGILVKKIYKCDRQSFLERDDLDAVFSVVTLNGKRYLLGSVYIPPNSPVVFKNFCEQMELVLKETPNLNCAGIMVAGDFNARNQNWGDIKTNNQGTKLLEFVEKLKLRVWSDFAGNSFQCCDGGSRIDLVISDLSLPFRQHLDEIVELFSGAPQRGHVPVWTTLIQEPKGKNWSKEVFDWDKTNWMSFEADMDKETLKMFHKFVNQPDTFRLWEMAKSLLLAVKLRQVPKKLVSNHSKPFWNTKLTDLSIKLREARTNFKRRSSFRNGEILKAAKEEFSEALDVAKNEHIESQTKKLNSSSGESFWSNFKRTFYSGKESNYIGTLDYESKKVVADAEKASAFQAEIFEGRHLRNSDFDANWHKYVESITAKNDFYATQNTHSYNENISAQEVHRAVKKINGSKRSVDTDGIHPLMIKHCGQQFQMVLFILFNSAFSSGNWPWQEGNVTLIKKPGKDNYNVLGSYRPITITSYIGKLFEGILKLRIQNFLDTHGILSLNQHGFRAGYSTSSYMLELLSAIENNVKRHIFTAGIFVDLQKAFDSVWISGLEYKLKDIGIEGPMLRILHSFLGSRRIQIKVNDSIGQKFDCKIGVPQGSVLSPTLFALYINDMLEGLPNHVRPFQYADDTSIVVQGADHKEMSENCQLVCSKISLWLKKWRLKANCAKTDLLVFYGSSDNPVLSGEKILQQKETKVLGINLDEKLSFDSHLAKCQNMIQQKWNLLKPFIFRGLSVQTSKFILLQVIMPKTHYLGFIWDQKLRFSVYQMVKCISRVPFNPGTEHIFAITDILPLDLYYSAQRLSLIRNLIKIGKLDILINLPKSSIMGNFKTALSKFTGERNFANCLSTTVSHITKNSIHKFIHNQWVSKYKNYCRGNPCSGLLSDFEVLENIIDRNRVPLTIKPEVFGGICGLLTGHCRLQEHLYKLRLTFTPCCICLIEDESPHHYLYTCPLHETSRRLCKPDINNWMSIANFVYHSGRKP